MEKVNERDFHVKKVTRACSRKAKPNSPLQVALEIVVPVSSTKPSHYTRSERCRPQE
jgi:hypothetical protein